jgi:hypothetical protein
MSYEPHTFKTGDLLKADQMNDITTGIKGVETDLSAKIETAKSELSTSINAVQESVTALSEKKSTLTDDARRLILSLFENAVYTNDNMKATLKALKQEWVTTTDKYGTMLYKLVDTTKLDGSTYIDTGVKLFEDGASGNFTIVCAFTTPITCAQGMPKNLFTCEYDGGQGVMVRMAIEGTWTVYGGSGAFNFDDNCFSYTGKTVAEILNGDGTMNVIAIAKDGDNWYFWLNGYLAWNSPLGYAFSGTIPEDLTLIFGARQSYDGKTIEYKTAYTLNDARVYNSVLTTEQINSIISDLKGV